jgi:aspartyl-tRNA(Asn)/glutamyl-tRNA(Gln) amidotransferase subunit A
LVEATLQRIEATEPVVHAYVNVMADSARLRARELDAELRIGEWRGPLHGIPIALKDLFHVVDAPTEAGSLVLAGHVSPSDATVVALLRKCGVVLIGKTVTHEFAYAHNTPPTRNPWNTDFLPGGSSAGSAVSVAVGSTFGALGTDTGGSVRIPAAASGVVGFKPTFGLVSKRGVISLSWSLDHVGVLTRSVQDCALLLRPIAAFDPLDPNSIEAEVPEYDAMLEGDATGLRLGVDHEFFLYDDVTADVRTAANAALHVFRRLGADVVEVRIPELDLAPDVGSTVILAEASSWHHDLLRQAEARYEDGTRFTLELGQLIPAQHYLMAQRARALVRDGVRRAFDSYCLDAIVGPTSPVTATRAGRPPTGPSGGQEPDTQLELHHCLPANITGQPAISVPCGFDRHGLPIGLQIMGRPFEESTVLRLADAYERATPWAESRPLMGNDPSGSGIDATE